ncbi:MAG: hypothetical protein IKX17_02220 [Prevotella sp.]|nr:hypothetical protein [Prevotella sp.]
MKKVFLMLVAVGAMTFVSCDNKPKANAEEVVEEVTLTQEEADAEADNYIASLTDILDNTKDVNKLQEVLEAVKAKAAEYVGLNPEIAKVFVAKVQNFLKDKADVVKGLIGNNLAATAAFAALTEAPAETIVSGFMSAAADKVGDVVDGAKEAVEGAADAAAGAVENAKDAVVEKANETVDAAKEKAAEAVDGAADAAKKKLGL